MAHLNITDNHREYDRVLHLDDENLVFAIGSAGTGKTYGACKAAAEYLKECSRNKLVIIRPVVELAEGLGFLPGDEKIKLAPWMRPFIHALVENGMFIPSAEDFLFHPQIEVLQLAHAGGVTLDQSFVILDEGQNMTFKQINTFATRIGKNTKAVFCGDTIQVSERFKNSGLEEYLRMLKFYDSQDHVITFTKDDCMRSGICKRHIEMAEDWAVESPALKVSGR